MGKKIDLLSDNIPKLLDRYLSTGIWGMLMFFLYILLNTIIVGQGVGREGLVALVIIIIVGKSEEKNINACFKED
ncbi:hypothetical protein GOM49_01555 [Clostridium bovifaecis]|uniref:Uncharacterized protein n=1 Tax=Clostridium bovifaecis TaxID=2184719 RepID=A0A6I6EJK0_9CLOT|nr:hypothetical protein GOM49_01555 [Clostridium bovifaecis]